jgi:hypothetical protein
VQVEEAVGEDVCHPAAGAVGSVELVKLFVTGVWEVEPCERVVRWAIAWPASGAEVADALQNIVAQPCLAQ